MSRVIAAARRLPEALHVVVAEFGLTAVIVVAVGYLLSGHYSGFAG
jgi:hypothetical protein